VFDVSDGTHTLLHTHGRRPPKLFVWQQQQQQQLKARQRTFAPGSLTKQSMRYSMLYLKNLDGWRVHLQKMQNAEFAPARAAPTALTTKHRRDQ
jgi:hypothetical protein